MCQGSMVRLLGARAESPPSLRDAVGRALGAVARLLAVLAVRFRR